MIEPAATTKVFELVGGAVCLDFANTVGGNRRGVSREDLHAYADFLSWAAQARLLTTEEYARLAALAKRCPEAAAEVYARAIALREAIYWIFSASAADEPVAESNLAVVNLELSRALRHASIVSGSEAFQWSWAGEQDDLDRPLWPVVRSAAELLTEPGGLKQVRECEGDTCGWLFLDHTRNHSRRWCVMKDCGNRAKVRRYRQRLSSRAKTSPG